jgi:hypothetical protein
VALGRATGKEQLIAFNKDGSVVALCVGSAKDVRVPTAFTAKGPIRTTQSSSTTIVGGVSV